MPDKFRETSLVDILSGIFLFIVAFSLLVRMGAC